MVPGLVKGGGAPAHITAGLISNCPTKGNYEVPLENTIMLPRSSIRHLKGCMLS